MSHVLETFDATLHGEPTALKAVRAPNIPVFVWELLPVDLAIVIDFQRVDPRHVVRHVFTVNESNYLLMHENKRIKLTPARFCTFVLDLRSQRIRPRVMV